MTTLSAPTFEVRSPIDGELLGTLPDLDPMDVRTRVAALRQAQPAWEELGAEGRARWLRVLCDWLQDNRIPVTDILLAETGKARAEAELEVPWVCDVIQFYAANAASFLRDETVRASGPLTLSRRQWIARRPYPVVGVITPWNFPLVLPAVDSAPALLAGAAVVIKPSEVTPLSALELARGWREIGAPPVLEVLTGLGATGAAVVDEADFVQFTGSTRTGQAIAHRAVDRQIPYSLELGGKDPAIVLADADVERAVRGIAWSGLFNSGQACVATERVYVEAPLYDEFVSRLVEHVQTLVQHPVAGQHQDIGAMATDAQRDLVAAHVDEAVAAGARVLTGGAATGIGTSYQPTVLVDVDHSMRVVSEESFGPLLPVMKVRDEDEAVRLANDSTYGLSATVWTRDRKRGERLARRIEAGSVNINDAVVNLLALNLPHGGWKASGTGSRFGGAHGLRKFTREQAITSPRVPTLAAEPLWFPYTPGRVRLVASALRLVTARGRRRWRLR